MDGYWLLLFLMPAMPQAAVSFHLKHVFFFVFTLINEKVGSTFLKLCERHSLLPLNSRTENPFRITFVIPIFCFNQTSLHSMFSSLFSNCNRERATTGCLSVMLQLSDASYKFWLRSFPSVFLNKRMKRTYLMPSI